MLNWVVTMPRGYMVNATVAHAARMRQKKMKEEEV